MKLNRETQIHILKILKLRYGDVLFKFIPKVSKELEHYCSFVGYCSKSTTRSNHEKRLLY